MSSTPSPIVEYLRTIDLTYRDQRILSEQELRSLVWFFLYGENVFSQVGRSWAGAVFRQREQGCLLVVKSRLGDVPQVVFLTARTPVDCVRVFCRKWHSDSLQWVEDQYP